MWFYAPLQGFKFCNLGVRSIIKGQTFLVTSSRFSREYNEEYNEMCVVVSFKLTKYYSNFGDIINPQNVRTF